MIDLAEQAFPDDAMDDRRTKDQILTIFIDGLYDPCIRRHVIRKRCNDIQDALMSAINENDLMAELEHNMFITSQYTLFNYKSLPQNNHQNAPRTPQTFFPQSKQGNACRQCDPYVVRDVTDQGTLLEPVMPVIKHKLLTICKHRVFNHALAR